jgi:translation elongation factor EF-1beta
VFDKDGIGVCVVELAVVVVEDGLGNGDLAQELVEDLSEVGSFEVRRRK